MSCISLLRRLGLWPSRRRATQTEIVEASIEDASRENEKAFQEIKEVYSRKVPEAQQRLRSSLDKAGSPFIDLENFMHEQVRNRQGQGQRRKGA